VDIDSEELPGDSRCEGKNVEMRKGKTHYLTNEVIKLRMFSGILRSGGDRKNANG